jgi:uncharacterized protein (TIGR03435 family)
MKGFVEVTLDHRKAMVCICGVAAAMMVFISGTAHGRQSQTEAQTATGAARVYKYEVVSIKPDKSEYDATGRSNGAGSTRDEFIAKNVTLDTLVGAAYGIRHAEQLSGGPGWVYSEKDKYDLEAKMDKSVADELQKLSRDERTAIRQQMLQEVLATRFNLKVHHENRELPVYFLEIAKSGSKLKDGKPDDPDHAIRFPDGRVATTDVVDWASGDAGTVVATGHAVSIPFLMASLERYAGHILVDKTQLTGRYDFTLRFVPELNAAAGANAGSSASESAAPSVFTAVEEQLGLKLEPGRAPIDVIVIDHADRPSEN